MCWTELKSAQHSLSNKKQGKGESKEERVCVSEVVN